MLTHIERLRVRWVDTDASGRIHYTAAFRYFETAEWELFRKIGIPPHSHEKDLRFPRVAVSATFHVPLYVDDSIAVHISPERVGNTSVTFTFEVFREETRCISGKITAVFIDDQDKPMPIPDAIRTALTREG